MPTNIAPARRHEVGLGELFFSTTDRRGVIEQANSIFVRLSRYPQAELIGAPHNRIRHPEMPAGVFKLMWDALDAGRPFCGYVDNLAADGSTYAVFATITPTANGYLSVRARPMNTALEQTARELYRDARPREFAARGAGLSAAQAAASGAEYLEQQLQELGFKDYAAVTQACLPDEVAMLLQTPPGNPDPSYTGPLTTQLHLAEALSMELNRWSEQLQQLTDTVAELAASIPRLNESIEQNRETADEITQAESAAGFATSVVYLRVWSDISAVLEPILEQLAIRLEELRSSSARTRFEIAMALLHTRTVHQFILEAMAKADQPTDQRRAIQSLAEALEADVHSAGQHSLANAALADKASREITQLAELLSMPQLMISTWLGKAAAESPTQSLVSTMREQSSRTTTDMVLLGTLAERCRTIATPLEVGQASVLVKQLT